MEARNVDRHAVYVALLDRVGATADASATAADAHASTTAVTVARSKPNEVILIEQKNGKPKVEPAAGTHTPALVTRYLQ
jgi:hypothetical protein